MIKALKTSRWWVVGFLIGMVSTVGAEPTTSEQVDSESAVEVMPLKRTWRSLKTPNFSIIGDVPVKRLEDAGLSMERLLGALKQLPPVPKDAPIPTVVYVFKDSKTYDQFDVIYDGESKETAGYFMPRPHRNFIAISSRDFDSSRATVQHELVHYFVRINMPDIPLWLNEGLAEFYSNFQVQGNWLNIGRIHQNHLYWLDRNSMLPLPQLFAIGHGSPVYNEKDRRGVFYSQSWLLAHYLLLGADEGQRQLLRFLELNGRVPFEEAFAQAFERPPEELLNELGMYMRSERFVYRRAEIDRKDGLKDSFTTREMSSAEVYAALGELLVALRSRDDAAQAYLQAALALNPDEPRAHVALGLREMFPPEGAPNLDQALNHLAMAKSAEAKDPTTDYLIALARSQRGDPAKFLRPGLAKLIKAKPTWPEAWDLLAWAWQTVSDDLDQKANVFLGALRMLPDRADYAQTLLTTYRIAGRNAEAEALISQYFKPRGLSYKDGSSSTTKKRAGFSGPIGGTESEADRAKRLESADLKAEADGLVEQGRFQDAVELYEKIVALDPQSTIAAVRLEELRAAAAKQGFIDDYNQAVKLFNERRWLDTVVLLEKLLKTSLDEGQAAKARKLLAQAKEQRARRGDSG